MSSGFLMELNNLVTFAIQRIIMTMSAARGSHPQT